MLNKKYTFSKIFFIFLFFSQIFSIQDFSELTNLSVLTVTYYIIKNAYREAWKVQNKRLCQTFLAHLLWLHFEFQKQNHSGEFC